jgi:hypothetical protein
MRAFWDYILTVFVAYASELCELGKRQLLTVDTIRIHAYEFFRSFPIEAYSEKGYYLTRRGLPPGMIDWDGTLGPGVEKSLQLTKKYRQYETKLLIVADLQGRRNQAPDRPPLTPTAEGAISESAERTETTGLTSAQSTGREIVEVVDGTTGETPAEPVVVQDKIGDPTRTLGEVQANLPIQQGSKLGTPRMNKPEISATQTVETFNATAHSGRRGGRPKGTPVNRENLRRFCKLAGLTRAALANECEISESTIQRNTWSEDTFPIVAHVLSGRTGKTNPVSPEDLKNRKNLKN